MVTDILLSTIANIAISTLVSYLVVQIIPKKRVYTLTVWQQCIIILISCVTTFVLMSFSVDLPQHVKIDLRYNVLILLLYYFGPVISIPTTFLTAVLRLSWGIYEAAIFTFILYIALGVTLPLINKWLAKHFNSYFTVLILNTIYTIASSINLFYIYDELQRVFLISLSNFLISSVCLIFEVMFIEDMLTNVQCFLDEMERAQRDYLTGLYNRCIFSQQWQLIQEDPEVVQTAVLMLDIDYFKCINDQYGHVNGDLVLRQVAELLLQHSSDPQHVYRVGGEEFCILLNNLSCAEQQQIAEDIRRTVEEKPFMLENFHTIHLTVSIGLASSANEKDMKNLYRLADQALYQAKEQGRNQLIVRDLDEKRPKQQEREKKAASNDSLSPSFVDKMPIKKNKSLFPHETSEKI
ncbi:GGDEF domain-containing protein [Pisciglobus halotolerans]|uniref:Diguanylate cyclase n=1 Tax=Pisciglobus halotolerans TaxID=745365 RepID=A0A1I3AWY2_9LACT|nr:GGDEF domain-containing protein [Pisciglobus halotolerans]SFH54460.1 diguanylate cyclase [Pisciglobus halotolerans]